MHAWIWILAIFAIIVYFNARFKEGFTIEEKTNDDFFNRGEVDENKTFLNLYRQNINDPKIISLLDKYAIPDGVSNDVKLIQFFLDVQPILGTLDNCNTIKGYPVLFTSVLGPIFFMPYNEAINKYPRMIRKTKDYTMLKSVYTSAHNLISNTSLRQTCNQLMSTVCSTQLAPIITSIEDGVYYFVAKAKVANQATADSATTIDATNDTSQNTTDIQDTNTE